MPYTTYKPKKFNAEHQQIIERADDICSAYAEQGLVLTLRQLYYQFVARGWLRNLDTEYDRLGDIVRQARLAGLMDWSHLIDRTRNLVAPPQWKTVTEMVEQSSASFRPDLWKPQHRRVEVWVEKDAAIGVIEGVCDSEHVPYFSCRGYTSVSEIWAAAQRIRWHVEDGSRVTVLHIGDHDPSGLDMTRDIQDRLASFIGPDWIGLHMGDAPRPITRGAVRADMREHLRAKGCEIEDHEQPWEIIRIALNRDQIDLYEPPPNPAKTTDARFRRYVEETGLDESWELDALDPAVLANLIRREIEARRDEDAWSASVEEMEHGRAILRRIAASWPAVAAQYGPKE